METTIFLWLLLVGALHFTRVALSWGRGRIDSWAKTIDALGGCRRGALASEDLRLVLMQFVGLILLIMALVYAKICIFSHLAHASRLICLFQLSGKVSTIFSDAVGADCVLAWKLMSNAASVHRRGRVGDGCVSFYSVAEVEILTWAQSQSALRLHWSCLFIINRRKHWAYHFRSWLISKWRANGLINIGLVAWTADDLGLIRSCDL